MLEAPIAAIDSVVQSEELIQLLESAEVAGTVNAPEILEIALRLKPVEPVINVADRSRRSSEGTSGPHKEPNPCAEPDETNIQDVVQPLVVEDRCVSLGRIEAG